MTSISWQYAQVLKFFDPPYVRTIARPFPSAEALLEHCVYQFAASDLTRCLAPISLLMTTPAGETTNLLYTADGSLAVSPDSESPKPIARPLRRDQLPL